LRPKDVVPPLDYNLFKTGIKPMWEDESNSKGGKWMIRCKKDFSSRLWEDLILGVVGNVFDTEEDICGAVISIRETHDIISIWNKTSNNQEIRDKIREILKKILKLPPGTLMEYKTHDSSIKDNSSFRNTETHKC
jgi:translation initiation factor 4E